MGTIFACFQSDGTTDWWIEAWNMSVSIGAISSLKSFKRCAGISSGPDVLWICRSCNMLKTPLMSMLGAATSGIGGLGRIVDEGGVKIEVK